MQCPSCGATLLPGATHCPSCGTFIGDDGSFRETLSGSSANQPPDRTMPAAAQYPFGSPQPPRPSNPGWQGDPAAPTEQFAPGAYGPPPISGQQPFYSGGQPPPFTPAQPTPPRRGLSRGLVVLLSVLAVLIILSGVGLIYYSTVYHPAQLHAQATGTAQSQQTQAANATSTANSQATGTAIAITNATATANAQATAVVVATQTALQAIYTSSTRGTPALTESLGFNTASNWDVGTAQGGGGCAFTGGAYHASLDTKGFYLPCYAHNTSFSNFALQVQMTIVSGDSGGLVFRGNGGADKVYALSINTNGAYDLFVTRSNTQSSDLLNGTAPSFKRHAGQTNLVTVIARGSSIYIYVNKQYVGSITDNTYSSGQIGVLVDAHNNPTDVAFSNMQVWRI